MHALNSGIGGIALMASTQGASLAPKTALVLGTAAAIERQADQARDDFAQILDELDFMKSQLARRPTRGEVSLIVLRLTLGAAAGIAAIMLLMG
jgi:hypothetical protein